MLIVSVHHNFTKRQLNYYVFLFFLNGAGKFPVKEKQGSLTYSTSCDQQNL